MPFFPAGKAGFVLPAVIPDPSEDSTLIWRLNLSYRPCVNISDLAIPGSLIVDHSEDVLCFVMIW